MTQPYTLAQRNLIGSGKMAPAFRHLDRIPADPFPFIWHRTLSQVWGLTPDEAGAADDLAMLGSRAAE